MFVNLKKTPTTCGQERQATAQRRAPQWAKNMHEHPPGFPATPALESKAKRKLLLLPVPPLSWTATLPGRGFK